MMEYSRYVVKKIDEEQYLHVNTSKYGSSLNLTPGKENAKWYLTLRDGRDAIDIYTRHTKTATHSMLEIQHILIRFETLETTPGLPTSTMLYPSGYGITGMVDKKWVTETLEKMYGSTLVDFEVTQKSYGDDSPFYSVHVENIVWNS